MIQTEIKYDPQQLLTTEQAASLLSVSKNTLEVWRCHGGSPKFIKRGSRFVRYRVQDLLDWIAEGETSSTSEYDARMMQGA